MKRLHVYLRDSFSASMSLSINPYDWRMSLWIDTKWATATTHIGPISFHLDW